MFGNGAAIGMANTAAKHKPIPKALRQAHTACFAVAVGATMRGSCVYRTATTICLTVAIMVLAFVWLVVRIKTANSHVQFDE